jgi:hypothetical protein
VNWFRCVGPGLHAGEWLGLGLAVVLLFALCMTLLRFVFGLFLCKSDKDESERDYWRIHGG